jgi:hypothetical protein
MKKGTVFILTGITLLGVAAGASAYQGDPSKMGQNCTPAQHAAIEKAIAGNDYSAWKTAMGARGRVTQVVTQENFAKFRQAYLLGKEGKLEEAKALRAELGLGLRNGAGKGVGMKQGQMRSHMGR